jgi:hypothetical protein
MILLVPFLSIYEIETDDIEKTMKLQLERMDLEIQHGRDSKSHSNLVLPCGEMFFGSR